MVSKTTKVDLIKKVVELEALLVDSKKQVFTLET